jgi:hypothetical protein
MLEAIAESVKLRLHYSAPEYVCHLIKKFAIYLIGDLLPYCTIFCQICV